MGDICSGKSDVFKIHLHARNLGGVFSRENTPEGLTEMYKSSFLFNIKK